MKLEQARAALADAKSHEGFYRASLQSSQRDVERIGHQVQALEREALAALSKIPANSLNIQSTPTPVIPNN